MPLSVRQSSTYQGSDWWDWSVWIDGSQRELNRVESVIYKLHETFPEPLQTRSDRTDKFRLSSAGWGGFTIGVQVRTRDGETINFEHPLLLEYPKEAQSRGLALEKHQPRVFLSYAAADKKAAMALEKNLRSEGYAIVKSNDSGLGSTWRDSIFEAIKSADAVVMIASDATSDFVNSEIELARKLDRPVVPVITEVAENLPESIRDLEGIHVNRIDDVPQAAAKIADRIRLLKKMK